MAFTKSCTLPNGLTGEHWQIIGIKDFWIGDRITVIAGLFKDAATLAGSKEAVKHPLASRKYTFLEDTDNPLSLVVLATATETIGQFPSLLYTAIINADKEKSVMESDGTLLVGSMDFHSIVDNDYSLDATIVQDVFYVAGA